MNMWKIIIIGIVLGALNSGRAASASFASPLYEIATYDQEFAKLSEQFTAVIRISGASYDSDRLYVCLSNPTERGQVSFFRFKAVDAGGVYLTPAYYKLAQSRTVSISSRLAIEILAILNQLSVVDIRKKIEYRDYNKIVSIGYSIYGGVEYPEAEARKALPFFDVISDGAVWSDEEKTLELKIAKSEPHKPTKAR